MFRALHELVSSRGLSNFSYLPDMFYDRNGSKVSGLIEMSGGKMTQNIKQMSLTNLH